MKRGMAFERRTSARNKPKPIETRDTGFLLTRLGSSGKRVPRYKPLSVGVVLLDLVPATQHQPDGLCQDNRDSPEPRPRVGWRDG